MATNSYEAYNDISNGNITGGVVQFTEAGIYAIGTGLVIFGGPVGVAVGSGIVLAAGIIDFVEYINEESEK